jgi:hypothetical protein
LGRSCIALILWPDLSKDDGCASETAFQASVKSAPAEPSVQEPGIKGVAATCAIHDINPPCLAEKTLTPEMGFCTRVTQRGYHNHIMLQRLDPSVCYETFVLVHFQLDFIHENDVHQFGGTHVHSTICFLRQGDTHVPPMPQLIVHLLRRRPTEM